MIPFLVHDRDTACLSEADTPLKKGDMVLNQCRNGTYILHRVLKADRDVCAMLGDAQTHSEPDIRAEQVRAVVTVVRRQGKLLQNRVFLVFFEKEWIRMTPIRPIVRNTYSFMKSCFATKEQYEG